MTEISYLWDGIVTGDAVESPYDKAEFNKYIAGMHISEGTGIYVVPGYLNDLEVGYTGSYNVSVNAGAAFINNYLYINTDQVTVSIEKPDNDAFRYVYVVLEVNTSYQTVRINVVYGDSTDNVNYLFLPPLTQTTNIYQAPIAKILCLGSASNIDTQYIHDERQFVATAYSLKLNSNENLIQNSEFMYIDPVTNIPEKWSESTTGTSTVQTSGNKTLYMSRGNSFDFWSTKYIYQYIPLPNIRAGEVFTLQGSFKAVNDTTTGIVIYIFITGTGGYWGESSVLLQKKYAYVTADTTVYFKETFSVPIQLSNPKALQVRVYSVSHSNIGQMFLTRGYHPGPLRQSHELIMFQDALTDAAWSDTAKSTGTTTIDLSADFGGVIPNQTKAVILRMRGRDSGSAGGVPYMRALCYSAAFSTEFGRLNLDGVTNDVYREIVCVVQTDEPRFAADSDVPQFRIDVLATGAGTLDATAEILGIIV